MLQRRIHTCNGNTEVEATNLFHAVEVGETGMGQWKPTQWVDKLERFIKEVVFDMGT